MSTYVMKGRLSYQVPVLADLSVGAEFEADLDPEVEQELINAGAIEVLDGGHKVGEPTPEPEPEPPAPEPEPEPAPESEPQPEA